MNPDSAAVRSDEVWKRENICRLNYNLKYDLNYNLKCNLTVIG